MLDLLVSSSLLFGRLDQKVSNYFHFFFKGVKVSVASIAKSCLILVCSIHLARVLAGFKLIERALLRERE